MGTKNSIKTAAVMGLIGRGPAAETAPSVSVERPRDIETITGEILDAKRAGGEAILTIGKGLIEAKALLSHGEWLPWLEEKVEFSVSAANRFMRLAREWTNSSALTNLGATKALQLLALPESEREAFLGETHEVNGEEKTVIDMTSRELEAAIKERDEALKAAAQAQADQTAAEQARAKMAEDMAFVKRQLEMAQEGQNEALAYAKERQEAFDASEREVVRLAQELEALRSRPVEVAVEADPAAIEAARKEAEAAMQDKLNEARAAQEKARADLEQTRSELEVLRAETARAEKKASLAANEDFVLFKTILERFQADGNRLCGIILKERNKDQKMAEGFSNAYFACLDKMRNGVAAQ